MKKKKLQFPPRKISETFLDFSSPLLNAIGEDATKHQVERVLQITYTVWNAIVLDTVKGNTEHISMLRQTMKSDPMNSALIEQLISRKKDMFADDLRVIGEYSLIRRQGEWRLRADARDPSTIP
jgi:limonene-1,2-epoxide hydrolase